MLNKKAKHKSITLNINTKKYSGFYGLILGLIVIILDQYTKSLALKNLVFELPYKINNFFNLYLSFNHGAAFSFLAQSGGWQIWLFGVISFMISIIIIIYLMINFRQGLYKLKLTGLAFILGGALGNLIDRIQYRYVIDFISWHIGEHYWPTFNLADSAVCLGVVLLFFHLQDSES